MERTRTDARARSTSRAFAVGGTVREGRSPAVVGTTIAELSRAGIDGKSARYAAATGLAALIDVALVTGTDAAWALVLTAAAAMDPVLSRTDSMRRTASTLRSLMARAAESRVSYREIPFTLEAASGEKAFGTLTLDQQKQALEGIKLSGVDTRADGRAKGGRGKHSSTETALAKLACACGAWGFGPDEVDKARKQILAAENK